MTTAQQAIVDAYRHPDLAAAPELRIAARAALRQMLGPDPTAVIRAERERRAQAVADTVAAGFSESQAAWLTEQFRRLRVDAMGPGPNHDALVEVLEACRESEKGTT